MAKKTMSKSRIEGEDSERDDFITESIFDTEHIVDGKYYLHIVFLQAINAPHNSLREGRPADGLVSLQIAADQAARIAIAIGKIDEKELREATKEYASTLTATDEFIRQTKIADFQIFYILQKFTETTAKKGAIII
jgi:hypothetical protein